MVWVLTELRLVDLRQMFATIALGSGESVTAVQEQLGHSSPMTDLPPETRSRRNVINWAKGGGTGGKAEAYAGAGDKEVATGAGQYHPSPSLEASIGVLHLPLTTPDLHLQTLFLLNGDGRIISTREPDPSEGPMFCLVRGTVSCAWAVRDDVRQDVADELDRLAWEEPSVSCFRDAPVNAERYKSLVKGKEDSGPAFMFPEEIAQPFDTVFIEDLQLLDHNFTGWKASEVPERTPIVAVLENGQAVSVCFCARRSDTAAEAGLETAVAFRGRGFGTRVAAAWALAVRASGRIPLFSTSQSNDASLAVAPGDICCRLEYFLGSVGNCPYTGRPFHWRVHT